MNKAEVGKVLAIAVAIDARLGAADESGFRAKVEGWSLALSPAMDYEFAREALGKHYKNATESIMPAHLNSMWNSSRKHQQESEKILAIGATQKSQGMPEAIRNQLKSIGLIKD
jgi:hypothetical protein